MDELARQAIDAALECDWKLAECLNQKILAELPDDVGALNRIARAYFELKKPKKAKRYMLKVLKIDPLNSIAIKCLEKWSITPSVYNFQTTPIKKDQVFLEEPGKTKIVQLINLGQSKLLANLSTQIPVQFNLGQHKISVVTLSSGKYVGKLPDDLACRLIDLIKKGNIYEIIIKSATPKEVIVYIKEKKRAIINAHTPSFPTTKNAL